MLQISWTVYLNYHPLLTDLSCFRNDELNINIFIHVDDGLLFGPRIEVLRLVELFVKSSHDADRGTNGETR